MERQSKQIDFNMEKLLAAITHFAKLHPIITGLNHAVQTQDSSYLTPLPVDNLPFIFGNEHGKIVAGERELLQWVYKKGFEDLIQGIFESLIEAPLFNA